MKQSNVKWALGAVAAGVAGFLLLDAMFLEKYFFQVKEFDIGNKGSGKKLKIVLLTDLHLKSFLFPYFRKLAKTISELQPDLLLITGDTLDSTGNVPLMNKFLDLIPQSTAKVAIPGNNDYKADRNLKGVESAYKKHHVDFLLNESKAYTLKGTRIMVTGLDDFIEGESHFKTAIKDVGREEHHLLLIHSPLQVEIVKDKMREVNKDRSPAEQLNIQYAFAGHTHGGQVRLPGYVPVLPGKSGGYVNGWYNDSPPYLYVSKGFGTSSVPFRFDARSEVTVFHYYV